MGSLNLENCNIQVKFSKEIWKIQKNNLKQYKKKISNSFKKVPIKYKQFIKIFKNFEKY